MKEKFTPYKPRQFYWGSLHPHLWLVDYQGGKVGVGRLMAVSYDKLTACNLLQLAHPNMRRSFEDMAIAVSCFHDVYKKAMKPYKGGTVGEYSCLVSKEQFLKEFKQYA